MTNSRRLLMGVLLTASSPALAAEGDSVESRVQEFFLSDTATQQQGSEVQVNTGLDWQSQDGESQFEVPLSGEYGLSDKLELQADVAFTTPEDPEGLQSAGAGLGYSFIDDVDSGLSVSGGLNVLAQRDPVTGDMRPGAAPFLLAYKEFGRLGANAQLKAEGLPASGGQDAELQPDLSAGLAYDAGLLRPTLEGAWRDEQGVMTGVVAPGVVVHAAQWLEVGVSAPLRLPERGDDSLGIMAQLVFTGGGQ